MRKRRRANERQVHASLQGRRSAAAGSNRIRFSRMVAPWHSGARFDNESVIVCLHGDHDTSVETRASDLVASPRGDANSYFVHLSKSRRSDGPNAPSVSIPTGCKRTRLDSCAYFASFLVSAAPAPAPYLTAVADTRLETHVHVCMTVASQDMGRPLL